MNVLLWSKHNCPQCDQAKALLKQMNIEFEERKVGEQWTKEQLLEQVPNARSVPQILVDNTVVGGLNDLRKYLTEQKG